MIATVLALVAGVVLLAVAADQFVLGAARVALIRRVSPLVVGVVIIGFGTSCPELLVSTIAAVGGEPEVAVGNVVGSNLANLSLVLGVGAVLVHLQVASSVVRREGPLAIAAAIAFLVAVQGGGVTWWEGIFLLVAGAAALLLVIRQGGDDPLGAEAEELADAADHAFRVEVVRTIVGLIGTVAGAQLLLWGALDVADRAGLSEGFVGVTLVAVGTSLPELVTVIQSARRRETDLIVGNLLGSNLFNAFIVGGALGLAGGTGIDDGQLTIVAPVAVVVVSVLAWAAMATQRTVHRWEGLVLIAVYAATIPLLA